MNTIRAISRKGLWKSDAAWAQILVYGIALLIMVVGIRKVAEMKLTEADLFFGIVQVLILAMQAVIIGTLVGLRAKRH